MIFTENINIEKAIVHVLDQEKKIKILSDYELSIDDRLKSLITEYISQAFRHTSRVFAKFSNEDNLVRNACINILQDNDSFVMESKSIANELYRSMSSTNASSANLLICKYKQKDEFFIVMMKLDFSENFYTERIDDNGKIKIVVRINGNGFSRLQKLRKCTVISQDIIGNEDAEILLVDTQNGGEISDYYKSGFLDCELVNNGKTNTKNMIKELGTYINDICKENVKDMLTKTYEFTSILEEKEEFDLDEVLNKLFDTDEVKDEFKDRIACKNIDCEFRIYKPEVNKRLKNRTIVTENGIALKAKASLFNSNDIQVEEKEDGLSDIIIKDVRIDKNKI